MSARSLASVPQLVPLGAHQGTPGFAINRPAVVIGSRSDARIHLQSSTVSNHHALLVVTREGMYVRDLASRTGTLVNGRPVKEAELVNGDQLQIGRFTFRYVAPEKSPPATPRATQAVLEIDGEDAPLPVDGRVIVIGRRATCDVPLLEEAASLTHAIIFEKDGERFVRDLASRTGTFVNGRKIHQEPLRDGDVIRCGTTDITYAARAGTSIAIPPQIDGLRPVAPRTEIAAADALRIQPPRAEAPRVETPRAEAPPSRAEAPRVESPRVEAPRPATPRAEAPLPLDFDEPTLPPLAGSQRATPVSPARSSPDRAPLDLEPLDLDDEQTIPPASLAGDVASPVIARSDRPKTPVDEPLDLAELDLQDEPFKDAAPAATPSVTLHPSTNLRSAPRPDQTDALELAPDDGLDFDDEPALTTEPPAPTVDAKAGDTAFDVLPLQDDLPPPVIAEAQVPSDVAPDVASADATSAPSAVPSDASPEDDEDALTALRRGWRGGAAPVDPEALDVARPPRPTSDRPDTTNKRSVPKPDVSKPDAPQVLIPASELPETRSAPVVAPPRPQPVAEVPAVETPAVEAPGDKTPVAEIPVAETSAPVEPRRRMESLGGDDLLVSDEPTPVRPAGPVARATPDAPHGTDVDDPSAFEPFDLEDVDIIDPPQRSGTPLVVDAEIVNRGPDDATRPAPEVPSTGDPSTGPASTGAASIGAAPARPVEPVQPIEIDLSTARFDDAREDAAEEIADDTTDTTTVSGDDRSDESDNVFTGSASFVTPPAPVAEAPAPAIDRAASDPGASTLPTETPTVARRGRGRPRKPVAETPAETPVEPAGPKKRGRKPKIAPLADAPAAVTPIPAPSLEPADRAPQTPVADAMDPVADPTAPVGSAAETARDTTTAQSLDAAGIVLTPTDRAATGSLRPDAEGQTGRPDVAAPQPSGGTLDIGATPARPSESEVLESTEPTPESAFPIDLASPSTDEPADELSDTQFARSVTDFAGSGVGDLVETDRPSARAPGRVTLDAPALESPALESPAGAVEQGSSDIDSSDPESSSLESLAPDAPSAPRSQWADLDLPDLDQPVAEEMVPDVEIVEDVLAPPVFETRTAGNEAAYAPIDLDDDVDAPPLAPTVRNENLVADALRDRPAGENLPGGDLSGGDRLGENLLGDATTVARTADDATEFAPPTARLTLDAPLAETPEAHETEPAGDDLIAAAPGTPSAVNEPSVNDPSVDEPINGPIVGGAFTGLNFGPIMGLGGISAIDPLGPIADENQAPARPTGTTPPETQRPETQRPAARASENNGAPASDPFQQPGTDAGSADLSPPPATPGRITSPPSRPIVSTAPRAPGTVPPRPRRQPRVGFNNGAPAPVVSPFAGGSTGESRTIAETLIANGRAGQSVDAFSRPSPVEEIPPVRASAPFPQPSALAPAVIPAAIPAHVPVPGVAPAFVPAVDRGFDPADPHQSPEGAAADAAVDDALGLNGPASLLEEARVAEERDHPAHANGFAAPAARPYDAPSADESPLPEPDKHLATDSPHTLRTAAAFRPRGQIRPLVPDGPSVGVVPVSPSPALSAQRRRKNLRWALILLPVALVLAGAVGYGIWYFRPVAPAQVKTTLRFKQLDKLTPPERTKFRARQDDLLAHADTYAAAADLLRKADEQRQESTDPGFLADPLQRGDMGLINYDPAARWPDAAPTELHLTLKSTEPARDRDRLAALAQAVQQRNKPLSDDAKVIDADFQRNQGRVTQTATQLKEKQAELVAVRARGDAAQSDQSLPELERAALAADTSARAARAEVRELEEQYKRLSEPAGPAQPVDPAAVLAGDKAYQDLLKELASVNAKVELARTVSNEQSDAARKGLDEAVAQFEKQLTGAQKTLGGDSPEMIAYIAAAKAMFETTKQLTDDLIRRSDIQRKKMVERKNNLEAFFAKQREAKFKEDATLKELRERLAIHTRQYNAAKATGLDTTSLNLDGNLLRDLIEAREKELGADAAPPEIIAEWQRGIEEDEAEARKQRAETDQILANAQQKFLDAAPAVEKLPTEQKAVTAGLSKQLVAVNDARKQYNKLIDDAIAKAAADAEAVRRQQSDVQAQVDLRRGELIAQAEKAAADAVGAGRELQRAEVAKRLETARAALAQADEQAELATAARRRAEDEKAAFAANDNNRIRLEAEIASLEKQYAIEKDSLTALQEKSRTAVAPDLSEPIVEVDQPAGDTGEKRLLYSFTGGGATLLLGLLGVGYFLMQAGREHPLPVENDFVPPSDAHDHLHDDLARAIPMATAIDTREPAGV